MTRLVLHVGLPKTATTFFQERVFPLLEGVVHLGKPDFGRRHSANAGGAWQQQLAALRDHPAHAYDGERTRAIWARISADLPQDAAPVLISHEGMTSTLFADPTVPDRRLRQTQVLTHRIEVATRLKHAFGDARVLFTIREPKRWLLSFYTDAVLRFGLREPIESWATNGMQAPEHFLGNPDALPLIRAYVRIFGREAVTVIPMELLAADPVALRWRLAECLQVSVDMVENGLSRAGDTPLNSRAENAARYHPSMPAIPNVLPDNLRVAIDAHCQAYLAEVGETWKLDLRRLGY